MGVNEPFCPLLGSFLHSLQSIPMQVMNGISDLLAIRVGWFFAAVEATRSLTRYRPPGLCCLGLDDFRHSVQLAERHSDQVQVHF